jgi:Acetyltransferases, including N-acetylases of ribosomal proteins
MSDDELQLNKAIKAGRIPIGIINSDLPCKSFAGIKFLVENPFEIEQRFYENVVRRYKGYPLYISETERLSIRELGIGDVKNLYELYEIIDNKNVNIRYTKGEGSNNQVLDIDNLLEDGFLCDIKEQEEMLKAYIDTMYKIYGYGMWGVEDKNTREMVALVGFSICMYKEKQYLQLSYRVRYDVRRKGYASEMITAILKYAKDDLKFEDILCIIKKDNVASIAVANKLGFDVIEKSQDKIYYRVIGKF